MTKENKDPGQPVKKKRSIICNFYLNIFFNSSINSVIGFHLQY